MFCQSLRLTVGLLTVQPFQLVLSLCQTWGVLSAVLFIFSVWFCNLMPFCIVECALCQEFVENMSVRFYFIITGYSSKTTGIWFTKIKEEILSSCLHCWILENLLAWLFIDIIDTGRRLLASWCLCIPFSMPSLIQSHLSVGCTA